MLENSVDADYTLGAPNTTLDDAKNAGNLDPRYFDSIAIARLYRSRHSWSGALRVSWMPREHPVVYQD